MNIQKIIEDFNTIAAGRGWQHLHTPKNLAAAIAVESGELLRLFQWLPDEIGPQQQEVLPHTEEVAGEIADVLAYLLVLADKLDIDVEAAVQAKMQLNFQRFLGQDFPE